MNKSTIIKIVVSSWIVLFAISAVSNDVAEKVIAEEITGSVVERDTGKPIANAIVAIRFERYNTGHGSPACFRSVATESDANGRFRFEPWTQENTLANSFIAEVIAYKKGFTVPFHIADYQPIYLESSRRSILGIRFSKNLHLSKAEVKVSLWQRSDSEKARMDKLSQTISMFNCKENTPAVKRLLVMGMREEILASPLANTRSRNSDFTPLSWIDQYIEKH